MISHLQLAALATFLLWGLVCSLGDLMTPEAERHQDPSACDCCAGVR
ncbi:MAG TPA: hypothetical protein VIQ11_02235 [Mycobacterium sp.]